MAGPLLSPLRQPLVESCGIYYAVGGVPAPLVTLNFGAGDWP